MTKLNELEEGIKHAQESYEKTEAKVRLDFALSRDSIVSLQSSSKRTMRRSRILPERTKDYATSAMNYTHAAKGCRAR